MTKSDFNKWKALGINSESKLILGGRVYGTGKLEFISWDEKMNAATLLFTPSGPLNVRLEGKGVVTFCQHHIEYSSVVKKGDAWELTV